MGDRIHRVGVVGCGLMGSGIAEVCARAGLDVMVREVDTDAVAAGKARIDTSLARATRKGKLSDDDAAAAVARIRYTTDFADLSDRQLVLEAVSESEPLKLDVFSTLDKVVADDAILASNTSAIPIMKLAMATGRPEQVVGLHFFSPVPVLTLVELVSSLLTATRRPTPPRPSPRTCWARRSSGPRIGPGSSSTPCSSPT
jgi:3-hydroxybutyryl-CoA dehydrogenase